MNMKAYIKPISDSIELQAKESFLLDYSKDGTTSECLSNRKDQDDVAWEDFEDEEEY